MANKLTCRVAAALALMSAGSAQALEGAWTHYGVRPLGMGNAFVAVADDFNSLFYNPAGLARLKFGFAMNIDKEIGCQL